MSRGNGGFNRKQARFIDEYLVDLNGARACRDAGYSEKNAHKQAQALLKDPRIRAAVEVRQLKLSRKTEITAEKVLERLWEEANDFGKGTQRGRVSALNALMKHFDGVTTNSGPVVVKVVFADG